MVISFKRVLACALLVSTTLAQAQRIPVDLATAADSPMTSAEGSADSPSAADAPDRAGATDASLYCQRNLGTWFYCEKPKPKDVPSPAPSPAQSADAQLKAITHHLDELKARAILEPTTENVSAYIRFQREQLDRASTFADVWQRAVWQKPELDYTLQRPVSTVAKRAWLDNRSADRSSVLASLSRRYGIFYFYAQSCAACDIQSPILKSLSESSHFHVVAVSMDGGPNHSFPDYVVDTGQRERMGLTGRETPALVLFDTATRRPIPIGSGLLAADEIADRIFMLTNTKPGSDF